MMKGVVHLAPLIASFESLEQPINAMKRMRGTMKLLHEVGLVRLFLPLLAAGKQYVVERDNSTHYASTDSLLALVMMIFQQNYHD